MKRKLGCRGGQVKRKMQINREQRYRSTEVKGKVNVISFDKRCEII